MVLSHTATRLVDLGDKFNYRLQLKITRNSRIIGLSVTTQVPREERIFEQSVINSIDLTFRLETLLVIYHPVYNKRRYTLIICKTDQVFEKCRALTISPAKELGNRCAYRLAIVCCHRPPGVNDLAENHLSESCSEILELRSREGLHIH